MSQFVALEVNKENAEYRQWARMFPPKGEGIPMIYIVSAQGQEFVNQSGAPVGEALNELLESGLQSDAEANEALEVERLAQAEQAEEDEVDEPEPDVPATPPARPMTDTPSPSNEPESMGEKLLRADSYLRMAQVFSESRPEKAKEYAQRIIDLVPDSSQAREARGIIAALD